MFNLIYYFFDYSIVIVEMKAVAIFAIFAALVCADSFRPVSKVLVPPQFDIDGILFWVFLILLVCGSWEGECDSTNGICHFLF